MALRLVSGTPVLRLRPQPHYPLSLLLLLSTPPGALRTFLKFPKSPSSVWNWCLMSALLV